MIELADRWCILRMSSGATAQVAMSLAEAGFDVWTPVVMAAKRAGPSRKPVERPVPLVPTIVFARADRLHDLVVLSRAPALTYRRFNRELGRMEQHGCPHFSIFRDQGHYPLVADRELEALRRAEWRGRPRTIEHVFKAGDTVARQETNFSGMAGVVQMVKNKSALVLFPGATQPWKFNLCDLVPIESAA